MNPPGGEPVSLSFPTTAVAAFDDADTADALNNSDSSSITGINWAQVYSSDEESQKSDCSSMSSEDETSWIITQPQQRLSQEPPVQRQPQHQPHRRPRHVNPQRENHSHYRPNPHFQRLLEDDEMDSDYPEPRSRPLGTNQGIASLGPSIIRCTPVKMLIGLFLVTCYTTFWLPYPEIRPRVVVPPDVSLSQSPALPLYPTPVVEMPRSLNATSTLLFHARAAPELELEFRPGLDRYYEQEGFSNFAWAKYANMGALGTVIAWAVREQQRRREGATTTTTSSSRGGHSIHVAPYRA